METRQVKLRIIFVLAPSRRILADNIGRMLEVAAVVADAGACLRVCLPACLPASWVVASLHDAPPLSPPRRRLLARHAQHLRRGMRSALAITVLPTTDDKGAVVVGQRDGRAI